ncbi:MAG: ATP-binding cassette domain-containing protein [Pseudobdellovibrio sp.]
MNLFLEIKNLNYSYSNQNVLFENFNYSQGVGTKSLWIGPSGCGKSTLAQLIAGHLPNQAGEVCLFGTHLKRPSLDCFYVGPDNDLFQWRTLEQQFSFLNRQIQYERKLDFSKVRHWAEELEVGHLLSKYPSQISTGEMRRFQILRTLFINSRAVIFDETFGALDGKLKDRIMPRLSRFWNDQQTNVIIISHEADKIFNFKFDLVHDFNTGD